MATTATQENTAPAAKRRNGAFRCFPGSSRGRIQGLLASHYPLLWSQIELRWLPTARPIPPSLVEQFGDYARGTLSDVLIGLGESNIAWDGFEVCRHLHETYGWQCDFHLAALIHAWSRDLADKMRS